MKLNLSIPFDKQKAITRFNVFLDQGKKIELTEIKPKRSLKANKYLHVCLSLYACEFGEDMEYVKQMVFKQEINPEIFIKSKIDKFTNKEVKWLRSSADLNSGELTMALDRFRKVSAERGCYIPDSEQYLANHFEIDSEIDRHKEYL